VTAEPHTVAPQPTRSHADHVRRWRLDQLRRAGYGETAAAQLSERDDVDLHEAIDLVRSGCPPETALRILL
jgi:hypothetical protein